MLSFSPSLSLFVSFALEFSLYTIFIDCLLMYSLPFKYYTVTWMKMNGNIHIRIANRWIVFICRKWSENGFSYNRLRFLLLFAECKLFQALFRELEIVKNIEKEILNDRRVTACVEELQHDRRLTSRSGLHCREK